MAINLFDLIKNNFQDDPIAPQRRRTHLGAPPLMTPQEDPPTDISHILAQLEGATEGASPSPMGPIQRGNKPLAPNPSPRPRLVPPSQPAPGEENIRPALQALDAQEQPNGRDISTRPRLVPPSDQGYSDSTGTPPALQPFPGYTPPPTRADDLKTGISLTPRPMIADPLDPEANVTVDPSMNAKPAPDNMLGNTKQEQERNWLGVLTDPNNPVLNKEAQTIDPKTGKPGKPNLQGRLKDAVRELFTPGSNITTILDPSSNERRQRQAEIGQSRARLGDYEQQQKVDNAEQQAEDDHKGAESKIKYDEARIANDIEDNRRQQVLAELAVQKEKNRTDNDAKNLELKREHLVSTQRLQELKDKWAGEQDKISQRRLELAEKELSRRIAKDEADRESREKIAAGVQAGQDARQQIGIDAKNGAGSQKVPFWGSKYQVPKYKLPAVEKIMRQ